MYIAPGQGQTLCPCIASFKMISSKSDFKHIFNDFIHVYSPGARAYNPLWTLPYHFAHSLQVKKKSDFIHIFNEYIYVYSPRARTDNQLGTTFDVNRKPLSFCPFVAGLKKML